MFFIIKKRIYDYWQIICLSCVMGSLYRNEDEAIKNKDDYENCMKIYVFSDNIFDSGNVFFIVRYASVLTVVITMQKEDLSKDLF